MKDTLTQPQINIGLVGHVDHGKTTLTQSLSGKWTDTHSEELKRGITIRLGYADTIIRYCKKCKEYTVKEKCSSCKGTSVVVRTVSFVDAPGHESLMATMLSGTAMMDGALLLVAANEDCPQPQTREHLMALEISGIKNVIIVQNKIDLVTPEQAKKNYDQIKKFTKGTIAQDSPIIPISAQHNVNIDLLLETIEKVMPTPKRNPKAETKLFVARSFDINKPGSKPKSFVGGVLGGALVQGKIKTGDTIEIRPGRKIERQGKTFYEPLTTKIASINTGGQTVKEAIPGGSIGLLTTLDPSIVKSDALVGSVVGTPGKLPPVLSELTVEPHLLERVVGSKEDLEVEPIKKGEPLMLNINSAATVGIVAELQKNLFKCPLKIPICANSGDRITISRRVGTRFRLIGYGIIKE
ncbi:translation initiation factor IF-2 subunit gamma [Candidatus Woesearchaeota archaeon]|nr:translation initiation factor IF-2 subunit gamma [Candidatus Woesearchaeota archaeon]